MIRGGVSNQRALKINKGASRRRVSEVRHQTYFIYTLLHVVLVVGCRGNRINGLSCYHFPRNNIRSNYNFTPRSIRELVEKQVRIVEKIED